LQRGLFKLLMGKFGIFIFGNLVTVLKVLLVPILFRLMYIGLLQLLSSQAFSNYRKIFLLVQSEFGKYI
jgi:hypothetical protein